MKKFSSWGRLSKHPHNFHTPIIARDAKINVESSQTILPLGNGRSYGDACLNSNGTLWHTRRLDHFISFDSNTGDLVCEPGVSLSEIQRVFIPKGWELPVTPGTRFVTVGGAIANDVHGKNHHSAGTFCNHISGIALLRTNGDYIECSPHLNPEWFRATVGGLGLTGLIVKAQIRLRRIASAWLNAESLPFTDISRYWAHSAASETDWEHTVAWIDCSSTSGRGIYLRANPALEIKTTPPVPSYCNIPFTPPFSLINRHTLRSLNTAYFRLKQLRAGRKRVPSNTFHYPLDAVLNWNRVYGPKGFYQYQCVVPNNAAAHSTADMLKIVAQHHLGSVLTVLKNFGDIPASGLMSFVKPGTTFAIDLPNVSSKVEALMRDLDAVVHASGGRIYLAKDARLPRHLFESSYPNVGTFSKFRDPGISSDMSRRLMGS